MDWRTTGAHQAGGEATAGVVEQALDRPLAGGACGHGHRPVVDAAVVAVGGRRLALEATTGTATSQHRRSVADGQLEVVTERVARRTSGRIVRDPMRRRPR